MAKATTDGLNLNITLSDLQLTELANKICLTLNLKTSVSNNTNEPVITSNEVLRLCKVSKVTLFAWRKSGKLPHKKIGNKIFYQKNDVLALTSP
jgi:predicted DNA-binding transcriptional regulator AlpA